MTRRDMTTCDGCGREVPTDETDYWLELHQRPVYGLLTTTEEEQATKHFCSFGCLSAWTATNSGYDSRPGGMRYTP